MWWLYELLYLIGWGFYLPSAIARKRLPHRGWSMRLGLYPRRVIESLRGKRPIWVHAVSVGEVLAAQPLLVPLRKVLPDQPLVLSTITASGFEVAAKQVADSGLAVYLPLDLRLCVRKALSALHPRLLILLESEWWPTLIRLTRARGIPIVVVNGRISPRAFKRYHFIRRWLKSLLEEVDLFLMQSPVDAKRLLQLGASPERVQVVGSLKWDASLKARPSPEAVRELAQRIGLNGSEAVVVAGSTHRGEEKALLESFRSLRRLSGNSRLIIAPRHLERLDEVVDLVRREGFSVRRFSQPSGSEPWDVGLVDVFGELARYYGLATVAFIGGSLIPHGGQNPLEAASLGKPIVFGPSMHNFPDIAPPLLRHQAARQVSGAEALAPVLCELLTDPAAAGAMGFRARELTERSRGALQRTLDALQPFLT